MADESREEPWMKIRRMASASARGSKGAQHTQFDLPPSPPSVPLKDDQSPYHFETDRERLAWDSPGMGAPMQNPSNQASAFSGISTPLLIAISIYSTVLSGIWFLIGVIKPHYGTFIGVGMTIYPSTASTVVAGFAKTIEITFVTVFLACLGQFFTKQAFNPFSPGIALADIQLKTMIVQPGTLITQWRGYTLVWKSIIGLISFVACITALFYTTASDALVTPVQSLHDPVRMNLDSTLGASLANIDYVKKKCLTPVNITEDPDNSGNTCIAFQFAGDANVNLNAFMSNWSSQTANFKNNVALKDRPAPQSIYQNNVTVESIWTEPLTITSRNGRTVSNVTMAMPHAGIVDAAAFKSNRLLRVADTDNVAQLDIDGQTIVPTLNVLCASLSEKEVVPMTFLNFSAPNETATANNYTLAWNATGWYNKTVVDDVFGFTPQNPPPVFYKMPIAFNMLFNGTGNRPPAAYILGRSNYSTDQPYSLCAVSMKSRTGCSSQLYQQVSGSRLTLNCDANNPLAYTPTSVNNATSWDRNVEWVSLAGEWGLATSLGAGQADGMASNDRILTQLSPQSPNIDPLKPSMVETIAALAASLLTYSTIDAPFASDLTKEQSDNPLHVLPTPTTQPLIANVRVSDYASGGSQSWQNVFVIILIPVFLLNCLCLLYLLYIHIPVRYLPRLPSFLHNYLHGNAHPYLHSGIQRDFTDVQNLFTLALGSEVPREGSLMRENSSYAMGPNRHSRFNLLDRYNDPGLVAERHERHRVLATKWHIREKDLGFGGATGIDATPPFGTSGGGRPRSIHKGASAYHIVVAGEGDGQHHFHHHGGPPMQVPPAMHQGGYFAAKQSHDDHENEEHMAAMGLGVGVPRERVRGRFEKYLSPDMSKSMDSESEALSHDLSHSGSVSEVDEHTREMRNSGLDFGGLGSFESGFGDGAIGYKSPTQGSRSVNEHGTELSHGPIPPPPTAAGSGAGSIAERSRGSPQSPSGGFNCPNRRPVPPAPESHPAFASTGMGALGRVPTHTTASSPHASPSNPSFPSLPSQPEPVRSPPTGGVVGEEWAQPRTRQSWAPGAAQERMSLRGRVGRAGEEYEFVELGPGTPRGMGGEGF